MWEYERKNIKAKSFLNIANELNEYGKEGWEVIYYQEEKPKQYGNDFEIIVLFKRFKEKNEN